MKKLFMLIAALCMFALNGLAQINIWSGNKLIYSVPESEVDSVTFGERPVIEKLTFEISVTDITAVDAYIRIVPSDETENFIWLCQPTSAYPDMTGQQIAESYTNTFKDMLDQYMGLYSGTQDYPGFSLLPETEYFVIAFGYNQGITSEVYEQRFTTPAGTNPEDLTCEITFPDIQAERASFNVKPNDNSIFYFCGAFVKEDYSDEAARQLAEATIDEFYQMQSYNPNYPIEQAVESVCYHGEGYGELSPLYGSTEYTFFVVPVTTKGKAVEKIITKDFKTSDIQYSEAEVKAEYLGSFDYMELKNAGYFTDTSFSSNNIVMAFKLSANDYTELVKYKLWYGATDATDSDLMGWINPYWDGERTKEELATNFIVFITNQYNNSVTFLSVAYDSNNVTSKFDRQFVDAISEGAVSSVADFEEILQMLPKEAKAPRLVTAKKQ